MFPIYRDQGLPRTFCIMDRRVTVRCKLKFVTQVPKEGVAKASPNRAIQYRIVDPKLSDLPMARVKPCESGVEA